jgi:hypothetical protein
MNRIALEAEARNRGEANEAREASETHEARPPDPTVESADMTAAAAAAPAGLRRDGQDDVYARSFRPSAGEIATLAPVREAVEAGDVLVVDPRAPGGAMLARFEAEPTVFGVVAAEPGVVLGTTDSPASGGSAEAPVAVAGIVMCKADAGYGAIRPGDLLQTSPNPGHAMRAADPRIGSVLGKALESLDEGSGLIRVLVMLR